MKSLKSVERKDPEILTVASSKKQAGKSLMQSTPEKSVIHKIEERNPYKFIEKVLVEAKQKLDKMKGTPQLLETLSDVSLFFSPY